MQSRLLGDRDIMTAKDRFEISIACSKCQNSGIVQLWQAEVWSLLSDSAATHIRSLPVGFQGRYGAHTKGLSIFCTSCNIAVWSEPKLPPHPPHNSAPHSKFCPPHTS